MVKPGKDHDEKLKETMRKYDADRVLNLSPGELIMIIENNYRKSQPKKGFVIKKTQDRRPHRTDVYLIKLQDQNPKEIDERWIVRFEDEEG